MTKADPGWFSISEYRHYQDELEYISPSLVAAVMDIINPSSVVEAGCGLGIHLREFAKVGVEVRGYDFSPEAVENTQAPEGVCVLQDLRHALFAHRRFDLCICSEVGEHLEERFAQHLVHIVTNLSDLVWWTAAHKQGGKGHVNMQSPEYWWDLFAERDYVLDRDLTDRLVTDIKERCPRLGPGTHIWADCRMYRKVDESIYDKLDRSIEDNWEIWQELAET